MNRRATFLPGWASRLDGRRLLARVLSRPSHGDPLVHDGATVTGTWEWLGGYEATMTRVGWAGRDAAS